jgi:hypothetical protein
METSHDRLYTVTCKVLDGGKIVSKKETFKLLSKARTFALGLHKGDFISLVNKKGVDLPR